MGGVPLGLLLSIEPVTVSLTVEESREADLVEAAFRVDGREWTPLRRLGKIWKAELAASELPTGRHMIEVDAKTSDGRKETISGAFQVRRVRP